jgi:hypothetical protein
MQVSRSDSMLLAQRRGIVPFKAVSKQRLAFSRSSARAGLRIVAACRENGRETFSKLSNYAVAAAAAILLMVRLVASGHMV